MIEVDLSGDSVGHIVFRVSPVHEVVGWLRLTASGARHPHLGRPSAAARHALEQPDVALTLRLVGGRATMPDFVTPKPVALEDRTHPADPVGLVDVQLTRQLAEVAATPPAVARTQAEPHLRHPEGLARLAPRVARGLRLFAERGMTAQWPLITTATARAVAQWSDHAGRVGLASAIGDLHPTLAWDAGRLHIDKPYDERIAFRGEELVICPSAVERERLVVQVCSPDDASVVVPIRWATHGRSPVRESALGELLGPTRARVLRALVTPASTTQLSHTLDLTKSTVAHHIRLLAASGLLDSERQGKSVLYRQTRRARDLEG